MLPSQLAGSQQYTATTPPPARATGARRQVKLVGGRGGRLGHPLEAQLGVGLGLLWEREIGNMSGAHTTAGATAVGCPPGGLGCGQGPPATGDRAGLSVIAREGHAGHAKEGWEGPA